MTKLVAKQSGCFLTLWAKWTGSFCRLRLISTESFGRGNFGRLISCKFDVTFKKELLPTIMPIVTWDPYELA